MEPTRNVTPLAEQLKAYLETRFKLLKYEGIDKSSAVIAEVLTDGIMAELSLIAFIFSSITLALLAASLLHSTWEGFGCITLLYIVIVLSAHFLKIRLQNMFIRKLIQKIFKQRTPKTHFNS